MSEVESKKVNQLLDDLLDDITSARAVGSLCLFVNRSELLARLEDIKSALPNDLADARKLLAEKESILSTAEERAAYTRSQAEEDARRLVDESEITRRALQKAAEITSAAEAERNDSKRDALSFIDEQLAATQDNCNALFDEINRKLKEATDINTRQMAKLQELRQNARQLSAEVPAASASAPSGEAHINIE